MAGSWATLPKSLATKHPLYGLEGWAIPLVLVIFIGPSLYFGTHLDAYLYLLRSPSLAPTIGPTLAYYGAMFVLALFCGIRLIWLKPSFVPVFYWLCGFVIVVSAYRLATTGELSIIAIILANPIPSDGVLRDFYIDALPFSALKDLVIAAAGALYVRYSKRINVTVSCRVRNNDSFLATPGFEADR